MTPPTDATATGLKEAAREFMFNNWPSWDSEFANVQTALEEMLAALLPSASVGGEREASVISLADALAVVDRCTPAQAGGMFSHTNSMRCIADDIRRGITALAAPETPPTEGEAK